MRMLGFAALGVMLGGCASVTRGTTENISISSTPSGVEAVVSGLDIPTTCTTPCSIVVKRSADISIAFEKAGYESQTIQLTKEIPATGAAGFAGNIIAGGIVGMGVDAVTGAAQDHKPNPVIVTMQPSHPSARARPAAPKNPRPPATDDAGS
jgi:hypothetical protein